MVWIRCGRVETVTNPVFIVSHERGPELDAAIDSALRNRGIDGFDALGQLCERCWDVAQAAINEGGRTYWASRRELLEQQHEANLGRPFTSAERNDLNAYFDGMADQDTPSRS